jgi:hypothetical protein
MADSPRSPAGPNAETISRRKALRSLAFGAVSAVSGLLGWRWQTRSRDADGIPWPLRTAHELNEKLWRTLYSPRRLAPTFPPERAREPRANGFYGLAGPPDPGHRVELLAADGRPLRSLSAAEAFDGLPRIDQVTELKCVEGWSEVVHWSGVQFAAFAARHRLLERPDGQQYRYVALATPDRGYYVGLELETVLHPQTLLCDRMNGRPLTPEHGAPLRLVTTLKYGVKNIKRIGSIRFTDDRPPDYWAERGYDWYLGH